MRNFDSWLVDLASQMKNDPSPEHLFNIFTKCAFWVSFFELGGQCCGSGSTCFWASWIRIRILISLRKYSKKNLDFYCFVTSFWLFIFVKWCKSTFKKVKCRKTFKKISFLLASWRSMMKIEGSASRSGSISQRHGSADPDPDPHQNVMDPQHCWRAFTQNFSLHSPRAWSGSPALRAYRVKNAALIRRSSRRWEAACCPRPSCSTAEGRSSRRSPTRESGTWGASSSSPASISRWAPWSWGYTASSIRPNN